jgi:hypothetical protein
MIMHPQGTYLGVVNQYKTKKSVQYSVEIFDLSPTNVESVAHQQIFVKRDVFEFHDLYWEPNHHHLAIHTLAKREVEPGKQNLTLDARRNGVDIYKMEQKKGGGFEVKLVGFHPSEKVTQFTWSPAGEIFALCEKESALNSKNIWSFYIIMQIESNVDHLIVDKNVKGQKGKVNVLFTGNTMGAVDNKVEFRKTARHEVTDAKTEVTWDGLGRYLCIYGVKRPGPFDKDKRSVRIFSMLGEQLHVIEKLEQLQGFEFRPRPQKVLTKKQTTALEKDYRSLYGKKYKEEERKDSSKQQDEVRERKAGIINEFLSSFFMPLREKYEKDVQWYEDLWPLSAAMMEEKPTTQNHLYAYGD